MLIKRFNHFQTYHDVSVASSWRTLAGKDGKQCSHGDRKTCEQELRSLAERGASENAPYSLLLLFLSWVFYMDVLANNEMVHFRHLQVRSVDQNILN